VKVVCQGHVVGLTSILDQGQFSSWSGEQFVFINNQDSLVLAVGMVFDWSFTVNLDQTVVIVAVAQKQCIAWCIENLCIDV